MASPTNAGLVTLTDQETGKEIGRLDPMTGRRYNMDGSFDCQLSSMGSGGSSDAAILAKAGITDPFQLNSALGMHAADYDVRRRGEALRKKLQLKDRNTGETKVLMDLSVSDVHIASAMPNIALGYHLEDGVADIASPVIPSTKQQDYFFTWNSDNAFRPAAPMMGASGAAPQEVNPALSSTKFTTNEFALAAYVPTEIEANADAPLQPYQAAVDMVMAKLRIAREQRVMSLLTTSGNWNSQNVLALAAGAQWNGGASSDPIANLQYIREHSYQKISKIVMGLPVFHALQRNAAVRQYHFAKTNDSALPNAQELSRILELPPIIVAEMMITSGGTIGGGAPGTTGTPAFVWPSVAGSASSVVLLHEPAQNPPSSGRENATSYTYRWTNAPARDGTVSGGFGVRSYYDEKRGARGGRVVVVFHNDIEVMTGNILGGLITGVLQ
jgi:hypothetical protein